MGAVFSQGDVTVSGDFGCPIWELLPAQWAGVEAWDAAECPTVAQTAPHRERQQGQCRETLF